MCARLQSRQTGDFEDQFPPLIDHVAVEHYQIVFHVLRPTDFEAILRYPFGPNATSDFQYNVLLLLNCLMQHSERYVDGTDGIHAIREILRRVLLTKPLCPEQLVYLYAVAISKSAQREDECEELLLRLFSYATDVKIAGAVRLLFMTYYEFRKSYRQTVQWIANSGVIDLMLSDELEFPANIKAPLEMLHKQYQALLTLPMEQPSFQLILEQPLLLVSDYGLQRLRQNLMSPEGLTSGMRDSLASTFGKIWPSIRIVQPRSPLPNSEFLNSLVMAVDIHLPETFGIRENIRLYRRDPLAFIAYEYNQRLYTEPDPPRPRPADRRLLAKILPSNSRLHKHVLDRAFPRYLRWRRSLAFHNDLGQDLPDALPLFDALRGRPSGPIRLEAVDVIELRPEEVPEPPSYMVEKTEKEKEDEKLKY
jgi:hypothetical protein